MKNVLLVFGLGYSAKELTRLLVPQGWRVIGTTRRAEERETIAATGAEPLVWPGDDVGPALRQASHVLISAGPDNDGDPVLSALHDRFASGELPAEWLGYLSTTAVYGDHTGGWVDETTPLTPASQRGKWRVKAENAWQQLYKKASLPVHIFRLAGIYGPGRGPFAKVRAGTARRIIKENQLFSRIHVEDIAQVLMASMLKPNPGAIYNLCDDDAAPPEDVIAFAAELLNLPIPVAEKFEVAEMTAMARSFYGESKKVRNDRIKQELGVRLKYPNYRMGLKALAKLE